MPRRWVAGVSAPAPVLMLDQNFPEHSYPSIVGRPILRSEERAGDIVVKDIMCGDEAAAARSALQITYPVRMRHIGFRLEQAVADVWTARWKTA